jgi:3D-(3,5/4)-trihydroxycyclohexane-1,2-dione acylhydrolase (decyclizing)
MAQATEIPQNLPRKDRRSQGIVNLTTAQAVVRFLQSQYSERDGHRRRLIPAIFGIFGHGNVTGLGQALREYGQNLPYYQPCNEQSMVHTAIGFAKANERLATLACAASIGPGSTNMITGAATATVNRIPVLLLPADYYATRRQGTVLQQLEHPVSADLSVNDCFRPVSRFFDRITRPEQLLTSLPRAMRVLMDPAETGAVTLSLPQDVQSDAYDFPERFFDECFWRVERPAPDPLRLREAVALLKKAKRPLIIAGGGIHYSQACQALQRFVEQCGIPIGETSAGKGAIQGDCDAFLGGFGVNGTNASTQFAHEADLVLCIGTRLTDFTTGSQSAFQNPDVQFININVTAHDAYKEGGMAIVADAKLALEALSVLARESNLLPDKNYLVEVANARNRWQGILKQVAFQPVPGEAMGQGELIDILNKAAQPGDTVIAAAGSAPGDLLRAWDATGGKNVHLEFGFSCMGYEIPAGLGVRMAQPSGEVYVLIGDGTYLMNPMEFVTALKENLKVTVVISENHGYQVIRQLQMARVGLDFGNEFRERRLESKQLDGDYVRLDLAMNAQSMGARSWHVKTPEQLEAALQEARRETKSCAIVVETEPHRYLPSSEMWWDVAPAETTSDSVTSEIRRQYEKERTSLQKYYC